MSVSNPAGPVVIVDPYSSGAFYAPAFKEAGVRVVAVVSGPTPPEVYASSYRPTDFEEILVAQGEDLSELVARLQALQPRCILPGCESGVELADRLAPLVVADVANLTQLAAARRHKGEMAAAVAAAGLPIIAQICTNDMEEVARWIERENLQGRDLVIKPPKSASTDGVTKVAGGAGWREVFAAMLGSHNRLGILNDKLVVQEYAYGTEFVVDTVSYAGEHCVTDICRYNKVDNGPFMAIYDGMEWMPPDIPEYAQLTTYAFGVLDAVGMRYGPGHIEIMLTPDGPRLIEIGARPHGGGQPRFCRVATGDSQIDRTVRAFTGAGLSQAYQLKTHLLVVFLICRASGIVGNAQVLTQINALPSYHFSIVNIHDGDRVEPTKDLFASLDLGFVILAHADHAQVMQDYQRIRALEQALQIRPE